MNPEMEITITIRGGEAGAGAVQMGGSSGAPVPRAEMGGTGAVTAGSGGAAPSPLDGIGAARMGAADAPSPMTAGAMSGAATGGALPVPVPLEEIERLSGSSGAVSGGSGGIGGSDAPVPEGNPG